MRQYGPRARLSTDWGHFYFALTGAGGEESWHASGPVSEEATVKEHLEPRRGGRLKERYGEEHKAGFAVRAAEAQDFH